MLEVAFNFDSDAILLGSPRYEVHTERLHRHHWKVKYSSLPAHRTLNETNSIQFTTRRKQCILSGVLWYSLGSQGTYSTWEGDTSDHISHGEKLKGDGGMSG